MENMKVEITSMKLIESTYNAYELTATIFAPHITSSVSIIVTPNTPRQLIIEKLIESFYETVESADFFKEYSEGTIINISGREYDVNNMKRAEKRLNIYNGKDD